MGIDAADIEGLAIEEYRRFGFDPSEPVDAFRFLRTAYGAGGVERGTKLVGLPAKRFVFQGRTRIAISAKIPFEYQQFYGLHEHGHEVFDRLGYKGDDLEGLCDTFAAYMLAPAPAVRALVRTFGLDHREIADEIGSTQTWAALRIAEYLRIPRAVVTPQKVYVRTPDTFAMGPEIEVRRLESMRRPGVKKTRLTDAHRRTLLDFEEIEAAG